MESTSRLPAPLAAADAARNHRSYVTVAMGCTGGQHRSVYLVERLAQAFGRMEHPVRHRELDWR
jgi:RNase adapter protein RapZ